MRDSERKYSDDEVRRIIEIALSLQKAEKSSSKAVERDGVAINDIDAIASEVGLSSQLIRRAASEFDLVPVAGKKNWFLGGETELVEVQAAGRVATERELEKIFAMMNSLAGGRGSGSVVGNALFWATSEETIARTGFGMDISVVSSETGSIVRIQDRLGQMAGGIYGGLVGGIGLGAGLGIGLGVGIGAMGSVLFSVLFPLGVVAGSYLLARGIYRQIIRSRSRRIRGIAERITQLIDGGTAESKTGKE
jgi:hypothetical protein